MNFIVAVALTLTLLLAVSQPSTAQTNDHNNVSSGASKGSKGKGTTHSPTASPSISQAPTSCQDNPNRFLVPGSGGNDMRTCAWVSRIPGSQTYPWRCRTYTEAAENCRITCGTCPGSEVPSVGPTPNPSPSPTSTPTSGPSSSPTSTPTSAPSSSPTSTPTSAPSSSPTSTPTSAPSGSPTASPSFMPTSSPSAEPTPSPTAEPTPSPTSSPSYIPTSMPTWSPSVEPTKTPTDSPSPKPTSSPTCKSPSKGGKGKGCSAPPTPAPSASPTPCQDIIGRFPVNGVTQACDWVLNGGGDTAVGSLPWRCSAFSEASANCKQTCGGCGCQDASIRFAVTGMTGTKSCEWVARKDTENRCGMDEVRFLCPLTCDMC